MHARFFNPLVGRFTGVDIVSGNPDTPQSLNRYSYVTNRPHLFTDPMGLFAMPIHYFPPAGMALEDYSYVEGISVGSRGTATLFTDAGMTLWLESVAYRQGLDLAASDEGKLHLSDFDWRRVVTLWGHGLAAYTDGLIPLPFVEPFRWAGVYDPSEPGMTTMAVTGSAVAALATAGATAETRAGEAGGNYLTRKVFRWGIDRQGGHGLHFHLGPGKALMRHHLPGDIVKWFYHFRGKFL
jgi:hypothetical protein